MTLKSIYLHIGVLGLAPAYTYSFKKRSRFICNWIEREVLKPLKFRSRGFDRIVVVLNSTPKPEAYTNSSKVACVEIPFDQEVIDNSHGDTLADIQIAMLRYGIEKCDTTISIPKSELFRGLDLFVKSGMRNEWLHKEKAFRGHSLTAALTCKMTQTAFSLRLAVWYLNALCFDQVILETEPDEVVFEHRFSDIQIENGSLVVTARIGPPLWICRLSELMQVVKRD